MSDVSISPKEQKPVALFDSDVDRVEADSFTVLSEPDILPFPIKVYPKVIQDIINNSRFPKDFYAACMLSATAAAVGASYRVNIPEDEHHTQPLALFLALVGDSAVKKSPVIKRIEEPFNAIDKSYLDAYREEKSEYDRILKLTSKERKAKQISCIPDEPKLARVVQDRITMEAISLAHERCPRGILWSPDELISLLGNLDRFNKGSNDDALNKFYDGRVSMKHIKILQVYICLKLM